MCSSAQWCCHQATAREKQHAGPWVGVATGHCCEDLVRPCRADQATEGAWEKLRLPSARLQPLGGGRCAAQEKLQVAMWRDTATKGSSGDA